MHKCAACNSSQPGRSWWDSKNGQAFVCTPCGLTGHGKQSAAEIRLKIEGSPPVPPVRDEPRSSVTRTKDGHAPIQPDTLGPNSPAAALAAVTQAAEQLAVAMRDAPPVPESMLPQFRELWAAVWRLAGVPAPPLPAAVAGKSDPSPTRHFVAGAGISKVVAELESETRSKDEPAGKFTPAAGLEKAAEADTAVRVPRFSVGV